MKRTILLLSGLLIAQAGLAAGLMMTRNDFGAYEATAPLAEFDPDAVDEIVVSDGEETTTIKRSEEGWILPAFEGFAADAGKVDGLIERLAELKRGWPAAQTHASAGRFRVAADEFERRVRLKAAGKGVATVYFGDSPSFKKVYARNAEDDNVYNVEFSVFDAPATPDDWIDRGALHLDEQNIAKISVGPITLVRKEDAFVLDDLGEDEEMDAEASRELVDIALNMPFDEIVSIGNTPDFSAPDLEIVVTRNNASNRTYRLIADEAEGENDADEYLLQGSEHPQIFRVGKHRIDALINVKRNALVEEKAADNASSDTSVVEETTAANDGDDT